MREKVFHFSTFPTSGSSGVSSHLWMHRQVRTRTWLDQAAFTTLQDLSGCGTLWPGVAVDVQHLILSGLCALRPREHRPTCPLSSLHYTRREAFSRLAEETWESLYTSSVGPAESSSDSDRWRITHPHLLSTVWANIFSLEKNISGQSADLFSSLDCHLSYRIVCQHFTPNPLWP